MNCYFHEGNVAVGQCEDCGKNLCKPCASKYHPYVLCERCAKIRIKVNEGRKKDGKKKAVIRLILHVVFMIVAIVFYNNIGFFADIDSKKDLLLGVLLVVYVGLGVPAWPSCFRFMSGSGDGTITIYDANTYAQVSFAEWVIKFLISFCIGGAIGIIQIIQCIKVLCEKKIIFKSIYNAWI